ncbi:ankyrin repeat-containing domain protein [Whalleya microplaca]|nr:ankyrin repeat-containing domain protein [Whalleya microplaca]
MLKNHERMEILNAIAPLSPQPKVRALENTCEWVINSTQFHDWVSQQGKVLFCSGNPGSGKTTMTTKVVDWLLEKHGNNPEVGIAYIYLGLTSSGPESTEGSFRALLRQLGERQGPLPLAVQEFYHHQKEKRSQLGLGDVFQAIVDLTKDPYLKLFLVVDGADECGTGMGDTRHFLRHLISLQQRTNANLFVTSLPIPEIANRFAASLSLEICAKDKDIITYIDSVALNFNTTLLVNGHVPTEITEGVVTASQGVFLLAHYLVEFIKDSSSLGEVNLLFNEIQTGASKLNGDRVSAIVDVTFASLIKKFDRQNDWSKLRAEEIILWVLLSEQELEGSELCHAIEISDGGDSTQLGDLLATCRSFIISKGLETPYICFYHRVVREYFLRAWTNKFPSAHTRIAKVLMKCLLSDHDAGIYKYAAKYWGNHVKRATPDRDMNELVLTFLRNERKVSKSCSFILGYFYAKQLTRTVAGAHLAAHFGLQDCMSTLVADGIDLDGRDEDGETPLLWAARNQEKQMVVWLLQQGADVNAVTIEKKSVLHYAATGKWETALKICLDRGAKVTVDFHSMTPLHYAVQSGWERGITILLEGGVSINLGVQMVRPKRMFENGRRVLEPADVQALRVLLPTESAGLTPLHLAAMLGDTKMVCFLLQHGANPAVVSENGKTPLHLAIQWKVMGFDYGPDSWLVAYHLLKIMQQTLGEMSLDDTFVGVVAALLQRPATDVNAQDSDGSSCLHLIGKHLGNYIVELLFEHGANPSARNSKMQTPLHLACGEGNAKAVKHMIAHGACVQKVDVDGKNALHYAAKSANWETIALVIEHAGATTIGQPIILSRDSNGQGALHHILANWVVSDCEAVDYLLEQGLCVNSYDRTGKPPLATCFSQFHLKISKEVVQRFLSYHADTSYTTADGLGLGHLYACFTEELDVEILRLLANSGLDLSKQDFKGMTILHHSALSGNLNKSVLRFILDEVGLLLDSTDSAGKRPLDYADEEDKQPHHPDKRNPDKWEKTKLVIMGQWADDQ